jgi:dipeptidyl aminopeptidase/acylaminoacyl peptidase
MTRRRRRDAIPLIGLCWLAMGLAEGARAEETKRPITAKDLMRFTWAADPRIAPDGSRVAFVKVAVDADKDDYLTSIWLVPVPAKGQGAEPRRLTNGPHDTGPRWSPDGSRLIFARATEKDGKPQPPQLYLLSFVGGEPRPLTDLPRGASSPAWSPDGKAVAFLSGTTPEDIDKARRLKKGEKPERESDVRIVTREEFRRDNAGYRDDRHPSHIWTIPVPGPGDSPADVPLEPRQLTSGPFEESEPAWMDNGEELAFVSDRDLESYHRPDRGAVYYIPAAGGRIRKLAGWLGSLQGVSVQGLSVSPDGRSLAFRGTLGEPARSFAQTDLYVDIPVPDLPVLNLTKDFDGDIGSGLTGDQHAPRGAARSVPVWSRDQKAIIDVAAERGRANLVSIDTKSRQVTKLTHADQEVIAFTASADGSRLAVLAATATEPGDLFLVQPGSETTQRLTSLNAKLFAELDITPPEEIEYASFDGKKIHAWIQKPAGYRAGTRYPLILNIHGGPHSAYGHTFSHEFHLMAARGYVVLYPNPRGSTGYGAEFGNIIQYRYPGDDYKDLMAGVDELERRGIADPKRLGVTGGSGGGLLTNWAITQTDRFAAAVSQRSIADWSAWWYTADFTLFQPRWFRSPPFRDPQEYASRSPLTYVEKVKTPLMLIEGESDYRTPPGAGGEAMFRALTFLKKPVVMVRFPGEPHELSRSGKPWHRVERLEHIVNWFDKHLLGKSMPQYDLPAVTE